MGWVGLEFRGEVVGALGKWMGWGGEGEGFLGGEDWDVLMLWNGFFLGDGISREKGRIVESLAVEMAVNANSQKPSLPFHIPLNHPSIRPSLTIQMAL